MRCTQDTSPPSTCLFLQLHGSQPPCPTPSWTCFHHMTCSSWAHVPQLPSWHCRAQELRSPKPESPRAPQQKKALARLTRESPRTATRSPRHSQDPVHASCRGWSLAWLWCSACPGHDLWTLHKEPAHATRGEDWASQGQPKGKAEIPVVTRECRRNSRKTTCPQHRVVLEPSDHPVSRSSQRTALLVLSDCDLDLQ